MLTGEKLLHKLQTGAFDNTFKMMYPFTDLEQIRNRYIGAMAEFEALYGGSRNREMTFISAPGRTEICGNHTDHQRGRVLAASVNLDIICVVSKNDENVVRIKSEGHAQDLVDLRVLAVQQIEKGKSISIVRGIVSRFSQLEYEIGGFDAYTTSNVLKGSGLSSSAAFEVAVGNILSTLYNDSIVSPTEIAQIGQYAENVYFDKPCGLMDQMASSVGGFVEIDFENPEEPIVDTIDFDFIKSGHKLCIVDARGSHADLTDDYASIPQEMAAISSFFGSKHLREVSEGNFYNHIPALRKKAGDRAVLRAMHFFADNERVLEESNALRNNDFDRFKQLIIESGRSSSNLLQNIYSTSYPDRQSISIALGLSEMLLSKHGGAWRVHGGGFAGTMQAFVPDDFIDNYRALMETIFGSGSCYELMIRPIGGTEVREDL